MALIDQIKKNLVGLAVVGTLASPQGIDYMVNGPFKVRQVGDGISKRIVHEYGDKIVVTGLAHPLDSIMVDYGKDGVLDEYWLRSAPSRVPFNIKVDPSSKLFHSRQEEYAKLLKR